MLLYFDVSGVKIPAYGTLALIGITLALALSFKLAGRYKIPRYHIWYAFAYGGMGMILGAKLFYGIPFLGELFDLWKREGFACIVQNAGQIFAEMFAGYVFYGGLLGLFAGVYFYVKWRRLPALVFADILAVVIPLFHGFGRIGCFLAGCCYGREYEGIFAVRFPVNPYEPGIEDVSRFPVQLLESGCNFLLFLFLLLYGRKKHPEGRLMGIYLTVYPVVRFITELFRGDDIRGGLKIGNIFLSTSQIVSMILFPIGLILFHHTFLKKKI